MAPRIDRTNLQKKTMRIGQMLRMEAKVTGEPPPKVVWKLKNVPLRTQDRLKIENEDEASRACSDFFSASLIH